MSFMQRMRFAARALKRDLAAGELRVLALALVLSVASVTAIGFFTERVRYAMERQAADVLAADLKAQSGLPMPDSLAEVAKRQALRHAETINFPSMALAPDGATSQLVELKSFTPGYPLRGALELSLLNQPDAVLQTPPPVPAVGTVWIDPQLLARFDINEGDSIRLGSIDFKVTHLIRFEPDRGQNVFEIGPRVMINRADVDRAELLGPGSRAEYAALFAGESESIRAMRDWLETAHGEQLRIRDINQGGPELSSALDRARRFLGLASVVTVLLAGAAVALATRQFGLRQADASAVLRTLGATRGDVIAWLVLRLLAIGLIATLIGIAIGWSGQYLLANALAGWFGTDLPGPGPTAPLIGLATALVTLAGFGLVPVLRAGQVPITLVLQRQYQRLAPGSVITLVGAVLSTLLIARLLSGDWLLGLIVIGGVVVLLSVFAVFGALIVSLLRNVGGKRYRLALAGLQRRRASSVVQLAAFATGIMALLLVSIVRVDILDAWQSEIAPDAPNAFVLNIQPDQAEAFTARLLDDGIDDAETFPIARARLSAVNGEAPKRAEDGHSGRRERGEYNLGRAITLSDSNEIRAGQWWREDSTVAELSVEEEFAMENGFEIGDELSFDIGGIAASGTITSIRKVDWGSFDVNFFVFGNAAFFEGLPSSYIASVHVADNYTARTSAWARDFPGIVTLDIGAIISRVKNLMERASQAVEYVFLFTLLAGVVVLLAAVQASQSERLREVALLRTLGASHRQVREALVAEFAILGAIAGFLAALFASAIAWALSRWVFELPWSPDPVLWLLAIVGGAVGITAAGYLATRRILEQGPARVLAR